MSFDIGSWLKRFEFFDREQRDLIVSSLETTALETGVFLDDIEEAKQTVYALYDFVQKLQSKFALKEQVKE